MKKNMIPAIMLIASTFLFSSCITLFGKKQTITVRTSNGERAQVYSGGVYKGVTPCTFKSKKPQTIRLDYNGTSSYIVPKGIFRDAILWELLPGCWLGFIVDLLNCPEKYARTDYNVELVKPTYSNTSTKSSSTYSANNTTSTPQKKEKTAYEKAEPEIRRSVEEFEKGNYSTVISIISNILNTYKGSIPYYIRGLAYSKKKNTKLAIDDFTSALSYSCDDELRRRLYLNRGYCKLLLGDYDGGVADMRNAGEEGKAFLKENNLENYRTGQYKSSSNGSNRGGQNVPPLKKGNMSEERRAIGIPELRKTK